VIGAPVMFKNTESDMALVFMKNNLWLREPYGYNQLSAVNKLATIAKNNMLVIATECTKTAEQLRRWTTNNDEKKRFGLGYALTLAVFDLIENEHITIERVFNNDDDFNSGFMSV